MVEPEEIPSTFSATESNDLASLVLGLSNSDIQVQASACHKIRKLLSAEKNPPIDDVIRSGAVPRFVYFLSLFNNPDIQLEAAWALTNIASGTSSQTRTVVDSGAIPYFVQLLGSPREDVREQAVWAIGNIAGDGAHGRDLLLANNTMAALITIFTANASAALLRTATWTLSNLCRGKPAPQFEKVSAALPLLADLLKVNDAEVLTDACWAASYLSDGPNEKIKAVIDAGLANLLVQHLSHPNLTVSTPALRAVGNIVTGDEQQTQAVLNLNPLPRIKAFMESTKRGLRKEACWVASNITAGTPAQIGAIINAGIIQNLIKLMATGDFDVRREAVWAITNSISGGTSQHVDYLVRAGVIKPLCEILTVSDSKLVLISLEAIENILKTGQDIARKTGQENDYDVLVEEAEGVDKMDALQKHENEEIYKKAVEILSTYYQAEEEDGENQSSNIQSFSFNTKPTPLQFAF